jgi:hypothetical protein
VNPIFKLIKDELDDDIAATVDDSEESHLRAAFVQLIRNTGQLVWTTRNVVNSDGCVRVTEP